MGLWIFRLAKERGNIIGAYPVQTKKAFLVGMNGGVRSLEREQEYGIALEYIFASSINASSINCLKTKPHVCLFLNPLDTYILTSTVGLR